jgi:hypothetical protein
MMKKVSILLLVVLVSALLLSGWALAFMPSEKAGYPHTVWTDRNIKGTVSGKVVSSMDQSMGVEGAYVALVDAMSPGREYANTTTGANGEFSIGGLGATYSSVRQIGPDGSAGTLSQGMNMFMMYVNKTGGGEGYSSTFGIDTNHTTTPIGTIVIYAGVPEATATPEPTVLPTIVVATPEPTAQPTAVPTITPETVTPAPPAGLAGYAGPILVVALLLVLAAAAAVVYFKFLRNRLVRKIRKK